MFQSIFVPFFTIGIAELLDKSQLSIILLSAKTKRSLSLLFGILLAFALVDGIAVVFGTWITSVVPLGMTKILAALIFIGFGILTLKSSPVVTNNKHYTKNAFVSGFLLVFFSEWGDKTQIASGVLATQFNPVLVIISVLCALLLLSLLALYFGRFLTTKLKRDEITKVAGITFIVLGVSFLLF